MDTMCSSPEAPSNACSFKAESKRCPIRRMHCHRKWRPVSKPLTPHKSSMKLNKLKPMTPSVAANMPATKLAERGSSLKASVASGANETTPATTGKRTGMSNAQGLG